ncbi:Alpha/Beta hydrolase protein [Trametes polyzona]|nr:Alpha/Beta hydrolase protein [Trametes polyzona]
MAHLLDPELAAALGPFVTEEPDHLPSAEEARAFYDNEVIAPFKAYMKPYLPPDSAYEVQDRMIAVEGGEITVRCLVPVVEDEQETFPVLVNMHGGAWSIGSIELDDYPLRQLCVDLKLAVVNVGYRLAPEYRFPTAVNDCMSALKWVCNPPPLPHPPVALTESANEGTQVVLNAALLRADLTKGFLVGGHSAGANLAAVLAHETPLAPFFRDTPGRRITGQLVREPLVVHPGAIPDWVKAQMTSMRENASMPPFPLALMAHLMGFYAPEPTDPRFSPLLYAPNVHAAAAAAPAFVQGIGCDPLRDDARACAAGSSSTLG